MPNVRGGIEVYSCTIPCELPYEMGAGQRNLSLVFTYLQMELIHHLNNCFIEKRLICHFQQKKMPTCLLLCNYFYLSGSESVFK